MSRTPGECPNKPNFARARARLGIPQVFQNRKNSALAHRSRGRGGPGRWGYRKNHYLCSLSNYRSQSKAIIRPFPVFGVPKGPSGHDKPESTEKRPILPLYARNSTHLPVAGRKRAGHACRHRRRHSESSLYCRPAGDAPGRVRPAARPCVGPMAGRTASSSQGGVPGRAALGLPGRGRGAIAARCVDGAAARRVND